MVADSTRQVWYMRYIGFHTHDLSTMKPEVLETIAEVRTILAVSIVTLAVALWRIKTDRSYLM